MDAYIYSLSTLGSCAVGLGLGPICSFSRIYRLRPRPSRAEFSDSYLPEVSSRSYNRYPPTTCSPWTFPCQDYSDCIAKRWECDGYEDCKDGSDESSCSDAVKGISRFSAPCSSKTFHCGGPDGSHCIPFWAKCDNIVDCPDGSDECNCIRKCQGKKFTCISDHTCLDIESVCDGFNDCQDGSDEDNCGHDSSFSYDFNRFSLQSEPLLVPENSPTGFFQCLEDSSCISPILKCNNYTDCPEGSDEYNCDGEDDFSFAVNCSPGNFRCSHNSPCISLRRKCDNIVDCEDASDECNCYRKKQHPVDGYDCIDAPDLRQCINGSHKVPSENMSEENVPTNPCLTGYFHCTNYSMCVPLILKCNNDNDCLDSSDEFNCT
ncbi:Low-density lipoprotein receptor-related protein 2 [Holothuria leucospilota]|uniref:Low-density lipoprotein receptor-related protein 2 n=1 Tax=Holothuria leucospilota TaxID=206669 RepID=A0A9Q1H6E4_HOLLE|nr:Low-density lipoprotein receptor-related protein 2 [Holothuria leucospilota]